MLPAPGVGERDGRGLPGCAGQGGGGRAGQQGVIGPGDGCDRVEERVAGLGDDAHGRAGGHGDGGVGLPHHAEFRLVPLVDGHDDRVDDVPPPGVIAHRLGERDRARGLGAGPVGERRLHGGRRGVEEPVVPVPEHEVGVGVDEADGGGAFGGEHPGQGGEPVGAFLPPPPDGGRAGVEVAGAAGPAERVEDVPDRGPGPDAGVQRGGQGVGLGEPGHQVQAGQGDGPVAPVRGDRVVIQEAAVDGGGGGVLGGGDLHRPAGDQLPEQRRARRSPGSTSGTRC